MGARVTRACEYMGKTYAIGDLVEGHEAADKLTRLGFAEPEASSDLAYDPAAHTAAEVIAYGAEVDAEERAAVLEAEQAGKNRSSVVTALESHTTDQEV